MLAEEYILVDISLLAASWCDLFFATSMKYIQHHHLYLSLVTGAGRDTEYQPQQKALTVVRPH